MKICIIAYKFGTEKEIGEHLGTYNWFIEITRRLVRAGHDVFVIAPWVSFFKKGSREVDGVKVVRYWPPLFNKTWAFPLNRVLKCLYLKITQAMVLNFQKKNKPDVFFVWQARETAYALAKIKSKLRSPYIFRQITTWRWHFERTANDIFSKKNWYQFFEKMKLNKLLDVVLEFLLDKKTQKKYAKEIYKKADKVVFVSQIAADEALEMGLDSTKVGIFPVCIDTDEFRPLNRKKELRKELDIKGGKVILFIGRINFAEKGIGYLLSAMDKVRNRIKDANLVIIGGGGESQRMFKMIEELKLQDSVQTVGKKPLSELVNYLNAVDVYAMPSVWLETFGQVTIQAMACEVPVVGYDAGATPYINLHEQTGIIAPSKNVDKLAEGIIKLLEDKKLREQYGQAARQRVLDKYTYDVVINKIIQIIQDEQKK